MVLFIDRTCSDKPDRAEVLSLSLVTGRALSTLSIVSEEKEAPGNPCFAQVYQPGNSERIALKGMKPSPKRDLIGPRAHFAFSPDHVYEHTYLSSQRYCWQNIVGVQRRHGGVDFISTWKFDEN
jgi:MoaF C-terminal domain